MSQIFWNINKDTPLISRMVEPPELSVYGACMYTVYDIVIIKNMPFEYCILNYPVFFQQELYIFM